MGMLECVERRATNDPMKGTPLYEDRLRKLELFSLEEENALGRPVEVIQYLKWGGGSGGGSGIKKRREKNLQ